MRKVKILLLVSLFGVLTACIQDEMLNTEADIVACTVDGTLLKRQPRIDNDKVVLMVKSSADLSNLAPVFTLTRGATITPESGTPLNFSSPQYYTVTSEDRNWKKIYEVSCDTSAMQRVYNFELFELDEKQHYYLFYEKSEDGSKQYLWGCANSLFDLVASGNSPDAYPTTFFDKGKSGHCLKLETKSTGYFGSLFDMPIAAGNLFIGSFESLNAMKDPLAATHFGIPVDFLPDALTGYYQYKAGQTLTDKTGMTIEGKDRFDIYAVLFETDENLVTLDGSNVLTSPSIIAIARMDESDRMESNEWRQFRIPFVYKSGKSIDPDKLKADGYSITILFASSIEGDLFKGAVGSRLLVDEVRLSEKGVY